MPEAPKKSPSPSSNKLAQNYNAFMFLLNFFALLILLAFLFFESSSFLKLKMKIPDIKEWWKSAGAFVVLFCYVRLYFDYVRNKRWKA